MRKTLHTHLRLKGAITKCHIQFDGHCLGKEETPLVYSIWGESLIYRFLMPIGATKAQIIMKIEKDCKTEIPLSFSITNDGYKITNYKRKIYSK